jgi:hypothetical protein
MDSTVSINLGILEPPPTNYIESILILNFSTSYLKLDSMLEI